MRANILLGLAVACFSQGVLGESFSVPFQKIKTSGTVNLPPLRTYRGHYPRWGKVGEWDEQGFWFANFTVGASKHLILLIDTGSTDVYLNPGLYKPSAISQDQHVDFTITFATTNPDGSGSATISGPVYKDIVALEQTDLSLPAQLLGEVTDPLSPPTFPNDGLIGFAGEFQTALNSTSWFQQLCDHGKLNECRFGIAYKTDETGEQYFGYLAEEVITKPLSVAPVVPNMEWATWMDVVYDGKVIETNAMMATDSGTTIILGPLDSVKKLFDAAGIQSVLSPSEAAGAPSTLTGYFKCSSPPTFGFNLPSAGNASEAAHSKTSAVSHASSTFNILPSQLVQYKNGDNCTASILGTDEFPFWLVGQVFFQGKYIDHNHDDETMGFSILKQE